MSRPTARFPFIDTSPFKTVLPKTYIFWLNEASFLTNSLVLIDTSLTTRKILFMFVFPANNVFPATCKVYKIPLSSKSTSRWSSLPIATTPAYDIMTVPRPMP